MDRVVVAQVASSVTTIGFACSVLNHDGCRSDVAVFVTRVSLGRAESRTLLVLPHARVVLELHHVAESVRELDDSALVLTSSTHFILFISNNRIIERIYWVH